MKEEDGNAGKPGADEQTHSRGHIVNQELSASGTLQNATELETIINMSPAVFFLWRVAKDWPVDLVSANITQFGFTADEFMKSQLPYAAIIFPEDFERFSEAVDANIKEGLLDPLILEYRIITKAGEVRWVGDRRLARRNEQGEISNYQGVIMDITHRKRMEEELIKA